MYVSSFEVLLFHASIDPNLCEKHEVAHQHSCSIAFRNACLPSFPTMACVVHVQLPSEIIRHIVAHLVDNITIRNQTLRGYNMPPDKRGLALCSSTCRYWASLIRPVLFGYLTLFAFSDVVELLGLLETSFLLLSPKDALARCVKRISVKAWTYMQKAPPPWILVYKLSQHIPVDFDVSIQCPDGTGVFAALPRTLPPTLLPMKSLDIHGLVFQRPLDLIRFSRGIPRAKGMIVFVHATVVCDVYNGLPAEDMYERFSVDAEIHHVPVKTTIKAVGGIGFMNAHKVSLSFDVAHAVMLDRPAHLAHGVYPQSPFVQLITALIPPECLGIDSFDVEIRRNKREFKFFPEVNALR